jgi:hypothetical protein
VHPDHPQGHYPQGQYQQGQYQQQFPQQQFPQQGPPPGPPPGLVPPLGPPARVPAAQRTTALVVLGVALVGLSFFGGYEVALHDAGRLQTILWSLPAIAVLVGMTLVWQDTVFSPRTDGWVLEGTGLLGRQGIDLTRLVAVTSSANARTVQLRLADPGGAVTVDAKALAKAGPAVLDAVGRAVWAGQEQGRYTVSRGAAGVWGMPPRPDAPANGKAGATGKALVVVGLLVVGLVAGLVLGLQ